MLDQEVYLTPHYRFGSEERFYNKKRLEAEIESLKKKFDVAILRLEKEIDDEVGVYSIEFKDNYNRTMLDLYLLQKIENGEYIQLSGKRIGKSDYDLLDHVVYDWVEYIDIYKPYKK